MLVVYHVSLTVPAVHSPPPDWPDGQLTQLSAPAPFASAETAFPPPRETVGLETPQRPSRPPRFAVSWFGDRCDKPGLSVLAL